MDKAFSSIIKVFTLFVLVKSFLKKNVSEANNLKVNSNNKLIVQKKQKHKNDSHLLKGFLLALTLTVGIITILNLLGSCVKAETE